MLEIKLKLKELWIIIIILNTIALLVDLKNPQKCWYMPWSQWLCRPVKVFTIGLTGSAVVFKSRMANIQFLNDREDWLCYNHIESIDNFITEWWQNNIKISEKVANTVDQKQLETWMYFPMLISAVSCICCQTKDLFLFWFTDSRLNTQDHRHARFT